MNETNDDEYDRHKRQMDELIARLRDQGVTDEQLDAGVEVMVPRTDGGEPFKAILYRMKV